MHRVLVRSWVMDDVRTAVASATSPRAIVGDVLFDLYNQLPSNLAHYQPNRCLPNNPNCFWFKNTYSLDRRSPKFRKLHFVVRDSDPSILEVIWVVVVA